ncbi:ATP-dependent bile acid permease [Fulvia fulva]|uniref:ATP-dependent bile acid permease n=1 Tax=Passalora fulva TaxID=5499 RepID=A0A9Q8LF54_PASFU|nr:ATP-dependent bile acid permease [Fulvia fulva]UJO16264.1 ATP-dependent bile acid permease [Fulvia fulva]
MAQIILDGARSGQLGLETPARDGICFNNVWDPQDAHFEQCFLPVIAAIPAILAAAILFLHILRLLIPARWRPRWTRPFVEEVLEPQVEVDLVPRRRWTFFSIALCALNTIGLLLQTLAAAAHLVHLQWYDETGRLAPKPEQVHFDIYDGIALLLVLPWLVNLVEVLLYQPRRVPYAILSTTVAFTIVSAILLENLTFNTECSDFFCVQKGLNIASTTVAVLILMLLLLMPSRDPLLPAKDISMPFTAPSSALRSPEEALTVWQFMTVTWLKPLMDIGGKRQLEFEDIWSLPHEFQHRMLHDNFRQLRGTVIKRLLIANGIDLVIVTILGLIEQVAQYGAPVFLQLILSSMEDPESPKRVALTYSAMALCSRLLGAQVSVFSLWFGRRCYERSRGEMITMLYEKTLGRKISFAEPEKKKDEAGARKGTTNGHANGHTNSETKAEAQQTWWSGFFSKQTSSVPENEPASMGKILNLMRNDVYEVAQRFWEFDNLIRKPIAILLSISLVVNYLGWPSLVAVGLVIFAQVMNALLAKALILVEKKRRVATDSKLQLISQFVEAIRHLRWYGWQDHWLSQVLSARQKELTYRIFSGIWVLLIGFVNTLSYDLTPVVAFASYTLIAKKPLTIDLAFPALQLFSMMTSQLKELPGLVIALINAWVAVQRIQDFMAEPDLQQMATAALIGGKLAVEGGSFSWPGANATVLTDISISFPEALTVVCGEVASGKTALLQALLGELDMHKGQLIRPPEPIGYCVQTPWLQSMSVRENILFSAPLEDDRYRAVLDACALTPDLAEFKAGDLSLIGENGIGLSGGQRARVALARAVYSRNKILLLDDPLAALDQQTAEHIVQKLFEGPLLKDRTVVLVTHRTDLVLRVAEQIVKIDAGQASILDKEAAVADLGLAAPYKQEKATVAEDEENAKKLAAAIPDKFIEDEHRAYGGVQAKVYWQYIKAGDLRFWAITIVILVVYRCLALLEAWFLKAWGEAYNTKAKASMFVYSHDVAYHTNDIFGDLPPPEDNIKPWLIGFLVLALGQSFAYIASQGMLLVIVYTAAKNMFRDIMEKVAYATFRFYDVTPVGRLMNRMTSDIGVIDGGISMQFSAISWMLISWISSVVVIASITPSFLVFTVVLAFVFVAVFRRFIPTSQNLRRLEMVSLTPLMSNFGELLNGLATVRAFGAQSRFQDRVISVVDTFQKMDHFYWSAQAWLQYRYDILSGLATFFLFLLAVWTNLSPGLTAFALLSASKFVNVTHGLCRQYGQLQMEFVSVERVVELLHLEQEPKGSIEPPAWWPSFDGDITFKNVVIKYAPHLDPALAGITFTVKGRSKTAIIGRTGSGKSTLALALLATILPDMGHISVDNVDLAEVDKQCLRTRVTFLAQDPVLFPGSMRKNLDPVNEHTDEECELVLRRVCERQGWQLASKVEGGGKNLSQGQRQLVGLARAVLRRSAIIILDEATASIDRETAMQIQQVMHEEMKDSTVITIAHRLEAVRNADYCIVLGKGKIIEQGPAAEMLGEHREEVAQNIDEDEDE